METIIIIFLTTLAIYFIVGLLFGILFLIKAPKFDPYMADTKKRVRFLLFPGVVATWPFLIKKLLHSKTS